MILNVLYPLGMYYPIFFLFLPKRVFLLYFFYFLFGCFKETLYICNRLSLSFGTLASQLTYWNEAEEAICKAGLKKAFTNVIILCLLTSQLRTTSQM